MMKIPTIYFYIVTKIEYKNIPQHRYITENATTTKNDYT